MNERQRMNETAGRPDTRSAAPNSYYFPPASYPHPQQGHPQGGYAQGGYPPQQQPYPPQNPQGYQGQGYPGQGYPGQGYQGYAQPGQYPPGPPPQPYPGPQQQGHYAPPPPYPQPNANPNVDDAVAQIAARMRALDSGDDSAAAAASSGAQPAPTAQSLPPVNYGYPSEPYVPQAYAPPPGYPPQGYAQQGYAPQGYAPQGYAPAPGPDLSGLEAQLRAITAQIETLRKPPDFSPILKELRQDLSEIATRLTEAMPRRAVEALEAEVRRLAERIDISRAAGVDPDTVAGMERGLNEVRDALRSLKPAESLAGFEQAINNLSAKIDQAGTAYQDPASLHQLETAITALRSIVANVASNDTLSGLSEEVRGLSAKVDRVAASSKVLDAETMKSLEQRIAELPVLGAIERGFADLKARLDSLQIAPQAAIDPTPAVDHLKRDLVRTQDSLEAVHSTLGHLVDRLAMIETGIRDARFATEVPQPAPAMPAPMMGPAMAPPGMPPVMKPATPPKAEAPAAPEKPRMPQFTPMPAPAVEINKASPAPAERKAPAQEPLPIAPAIGAPPVKSPNAQRDRQPGDPQLPHDFPLEPGSGTPRARPGASAAERIAASEAALGGANPGGANHPGQTDFIAAARRAAQAAASTAAETPGPSDETEDAPSKSITEKMRSLFIGASVILLVIGAGRLALDYFDTGNEPIFTELGEQSDAELAEETTSRPAAPQIAAGSPVLQPKTPDMFSAAPSGVIIPERPKPATPAAPVLDLEATGSVTKRNSATTEATRQPLPAMSDKLPALLRTAATKGHPAADYEIGIRYIDGVGVPQSTEEGLRWLNRAADAGVTPAHFRLGGLYEKGLGVKKNTELARRHYVLAADKGHAKAMHNLAVLYAEGVDGKPDYKAAAQWFRRAAEHGVADSQYNLGILYARGIGIEQNLPESYKWFSLAAAQGDRDAAKKRDDVGAKLDAASLAAARTAAQTFTPQPQPDEAVMAPAPQGGWDRPAAETAPALKKPRTSGGARVTAS